RWRGLDVLRAGHSRAARLGPVAALPEPALVLAALDAGPGAAVATPALAARPAIHDLAAAADRAPQEAHERPGPDDHPEVQQAQHEERAREPGIGDAEPARRDPDHDARGRQAGHDQDGFGRGETGEQEHVMQVFLVGTEQRAPADGPADRRAGGVEYRQ